MNDKEYLVQIQENTSSDQPPAEHVDTEKEFPTRVNADEKLLYLDGLRGILCLIVVFSHCLLMGKSIHEKNFSIFYQAWMHHSPLRLLVAEKFNENKILLSGIIRRFPRLFIPSTIALLMYFAILHFRPFYGYTECHEIGEGSVDTEKIDIGYVLLNTFGQYFWMEALYTIQWTMQVEYIGSLFIYLFAFLITRSLIYRYRIICYIFLLLSLPIAWLATHGGIPRAVQYIQPFMFGLLLSDLHAMGMLEYLHSMKMIWKVLINVILIVLTIYFGSYPVFNTDVIDGHGTLWSPFGWMFGWFWISFGGFCSILLSMISKNMQAFLSSKIIHFLGKISFGIYLTHYIILCLLDTSFIKWTGPYLGHDLAVILGLFIFALPIIILISYGFYLFVDAPAVQIAYWIYFLLCRRCLQIQKRPPSIQRHKWFILVLLFFISLIISSIPSLDGYQQCPKNFTVNLTTIIYDSIQKSFD